MEELDNQKKGMAGEFLTVGKLFKKGLQTSFTFGNAKSIDIFAKQENGNIYEVQVKSGKPPFQLEKENINENHIYVFIILNKFLENEEYYIVRGSEIKNNISKFYGTQYDNNKLPPRPCISKNALEKYKDNWDEFDK